MCVKPAGVFFQRFMDLLARTEKTKPYPAQIGPAIIAFLEARIFLLDRTIV
jgi:hypothetical protein